MIRKILYQLIWIVMLTHTFTISSKGQELASFMNHKITVVPSKQSTQTKPIKTLLEEFEAKHHVSIVYKSDLIENKSVQIGGTKADSLDTDLTVLLKQHNLYLRKIRKDLFVVEQESLSVNRNTKSLTDKMLSEKEKQDQELFIPIKGEVTSKVDGMTIPGVNVLLKGTTTGTITDINGNYAIDAAPD